jgi:hypothetical protein
MCLSALGQTRREEAKPVRLVRDRPRGWPLPRAARGPGRSAVCDAPGDGTAIVVTHHRYRRPLRKKPKQPPLPGPAIVHAKPPKRRRRG